MSITALPESTVRLLGSHTVITTPADLVKELLDNAIDAEANSVDILVSPNFVDKIQVRDNGQGIQTDDCTYLGRAGYTSKITSFEDLHTLGGTSLGFRGQALASANNLGRVVITTRTAEDPTAMELTLSPGVGGVESQRRTSAPIGTTVSVVDLYTRLPVRKQAAVKDSLSNLVKIRKLLHAYALARSHVRLSFRIWGGSDRQAFSYSPRPGAGIREAVMQLFGTEVMSQCLIREICSGAANGDSKVTEDSNRFFIEAVLPKKDADQSRIAKGPFFSVDSRPVSAQSGMMKKLLAVFKAQFSVVLRHMYGERTFRDSFMCVNIRCAPGSYDPNIEPSKNVVLFLDETQMIKLFEHLCKEVYCLSESHDSFATVGKRQLIQGPQLRTPPRSSESPRRAENTRTVPDEVPPDRATLSRWPPLSSSSSPIRNCPERSVPRRRPAPINIARGRFAFDMSADPDMSSDEEAELTAARFRQQEEVRAQDEGEEEDPMEAVNPWTIAKMNAPARLQVDSHPLSTEQLQFPGQLQGHAETDVPDEVFENLPLLRPFGQGPADPDCTRTNRLGMSSMIHQKDELPGFQHPLNHSTMTNSTARDKPKSPLQASEASNRQTLPTLRYSTENQPATKLGSGSHPRDLQETSKALLQRHINDIPSKANPAFRKPKRMHTKNKHLAASNQGAADEHVVDWVDKHSFIGNRSVPMSTRHMLKLSNSPRPLSGNTETAAIQGRLPSSMPHGNETLLDGDSRKYLIKRQLSEAEHRTRGRQPLKRAKTDRLPLETVPQGQGIQHLVLPIEIDATNFEDVLADVGSDKICNKYLIDIEATEQMNLDDVAEVELRLKELLSAWTEKVLGEKTEVNLDLRSRTKGKMVAAHALSY